MKKNCLLLLASLGASSAFALPDLESFSDATASGGTSYATGSFLAGQKNAAGQSWWELGPSVGTGAHQPTISGVDLSIPGLSSPGGGHSAQFGGNGSSARLNLSVGTGGITSGTVYFSFAMQLTDVSGLSASGQYWAGFNNVQSQNAGTGTPGTIVTRVYARSTTGGYNIGLQEGSGGAPATTWNSQVLTTSDTVFLVGSYTFNSGTGDDVAQLWINPSSSTFGAGSAPASSLTSSGGTDIARVASFMLFDRVADEPTTGLLDDLRFGQTWADVTPPAVPEPSVTALGVAAMGLFGTWRMMRTKRN